MSKYPKFFALCGAIAAISPAAAHHSFAMFDATKEVAWTGTVKEWQWTNPHSHIIIDVPPSAQDKSTVGTWDIEAGSPNIMSRQGWSKTSIKVGDKITLVGHPMRDGSKGGSLFYALLANGKKLFQDVDRKGGPARQQ